MVTQPILSLGGEKSSLFLRRLAALEGGVADLGRDEFLLLLPKRNIPVSAELLREVVPRPIALASHPSRLPDLTGRKTTHSRPT